MTKLELIKKFEDYHHAFLSPEGVKRFTEPFGVTVKTRTAKATPQEFKGLSLEDDNGNSVDEAEGADALTVAARIADHLGIADSVMSYHGRGSQHRAYCEAIEKYLEENKIQD